MPSKELDIYIAASWKHQHAVEMLTRILRERGHKVRSFVENNNGEYDKYRAGKKLSFDEWVWSPDGSRSFKFDTEGATKSNLVIYIGPSGKDAAAEVGAAWASGVKVIGLMAKGEDFGLMRRMIEWFDDYTDILQMVDRLAWTEAAAPAREDDGVKRALEISADAKRECSCEQLPGSCTVAGHGLPADPHSGYGSHKHKA